MEDAYFERLEAELDRARSIAESAREQGADPADRVEIPIARDMADRVESILGIEGVAERVRDLEGEYSREEAALLLVEDFVDGTVGSFDSRTAKIEGAIRTAVALLTEGVVAAPIEGIDRVRIHDNDDGTEYVSVEYAGPIRSAGGTAQALSVLAADYARTLLDIDRYKPRADEIQRYVEEVDLYDSETGLQYAPTEAESEFIAEHLPIMLTGEATGDEEVSGYRDLDRVETNASRGGMCLVFAEGIALKAPKIQRYTRELAEVDWPWLQDLIDGSFHDGEDDEEGDEQADDEAGQAGPPRPDPSKKYLRDLIAGRPVFGHPSSPGGFRLRYGRARNHGFATAAVHPATMVLVEDFLAAGTQIKTERPGKAAGVVPVDTIEGPTVRLANGSVRRIDDAERARELRNGVEAILDLGEYLVNYGEFVENNHDLAPAGYTVEWWRQEFAAGGGDPDAIADDPTVDLADPDPETALAWARETDTPLHPAYTYCYHDIGVTDLADLAAEIEAGTVTAEGLCLEGDVAGLLECLLVEHDQSEETVVIETWRPLVRTLGFDDDLDRDWTIESLPAAARTYDDGANAIRAVEAVAPFPVRERAPTRIGARMGRPEKSEQRELSPAVHTLFPIGEAGGNQRDVSKAAAADRPTGRGRVDLEVARRVCPDCATETSRSRCPDCGERTTVAYRCPECEQRVDPDEAGRAECARCELEASPTQTTTISVHDRYREALEQVGERATAFDILKGVKGLSSATKTPEPLEKGVLRAKHDVSAFKDGTVRYDMTDLPVTAVRPAELDVDVQQLRALGYETDIHGDPLGHDDQLVELQIQDIVLSDGAAEHLRRTADFVDDLLVQYYDMAPYYEIEDRSELVGELVFGMAPHTSAAVVGRIVGFTSAAVGYAHPYFHAAKRRNCFHPETTVAICENGETVHRSISRVVESRLDEPRTDDFGAWVAELDGDLSVPSLADDGTPTTRSVTAVAKHPAPDHLVTVETAAGRSLTVTPDHAMVRVVDGNLDRVVAHELRVGDRVPLAVGPDETVADSASATGGGAVADGGSVPTSRVTGTSIVASDVEATYSLTVADTHRMVAEGLHVGQCDG
ncbi:MAG: DNA polymerase II large subunit, partial [Halococcoides sp.]